MVVSLALLAAFFGALSAGPMSDLVGRKPVIIAADMLFTAGSLLMALAESIEQLIGGRVVVGLAIGIASMVVPVYLSEIAPVAVRGRVVAVFVVVITAGQLVSSVISLLLGRNWRLMLGLAAIPSFIQGIWMLFMPESQRWLAKNERNNECLEVLNKVYEPSSAQAELKALQDEINHLRPYLDMSECSRYLQLFTKYKKCLFIGCSLQFF